jgi:cellulose synthase/poly-beta-1,6-N-acetylglucosamine synthase-like glycosyltransferase
LPDARVGGLPPAIAFLARFGVAPGLLLAAMSSAWRQGVSADAALLALPGVDADNFYQCLARTLGVRFETGPVRLHPSVRWPTAIHAAIAATIAENGQIVWLLAPRADRIEGLLEAHRRGEIPPDRMVVTSPARFSAMLNAARPESIRRQASLSLPATIGEDLSARAGSSPGQRSAVAAGVLFVTMAIAFGGILWICLCVLCGLVLTGAILLRLFATAASCELGERRPAPSLADHQLPVYSVIVALYREAAVAAHLVAALEALDYPRAKLDIKFVVEADDEETRAALVRLRLPARYEIIVAPAGFPRTKPRALNVALPLVRGPLVVVFDAEDRPEPGQLRRAVEAFAVAPARVACLQGRLAIDNGADSWLASLFAIEYAALFDVFNPGLAALGLPILLGGTSNHFRTRALRDVAGWDAWNVTEDADLGLRLARMGYAVEMLAATTHEEAPARLGAWLRQRRRWFKGWTQTFVTHSRTPRRLVAEIGVLRAAAAFFLLGGGLLGSLCGPPFAVVLGYGIVFGDLLVPRSPIEIVASTCWVFICLTGVASALWPAVIGMRRRRLHAGVGWLCCLPVRYLLLSCAAWSGVFEFVRRPFYWAKTEHGLARTSRSSNPRSGN